MTCSFQGNMPIAHAISYLTRQTTQIHNGSILTATGFSGLLYNVGRAVSLVFFTLCWRPSFFDHRISETVGHGLHIHVLQDIRLKEPCTLDNVLSVAPEDCQHIFG